MRRLWLLSLLGLGGCTAGFDPPYEIETVRVLGVQKDLPYAKPGDTVNLSMLWHDGTVGSGQAPRPIEVRWFGGCFNPPGDFYFGCYFDLLPAFAGVAHTGNTFAQPIPAATLGGPSILQETPDGRLRGSAYVFFTVCAGHARLNDEVQALVDCVNFDCLLPALAQPGPANETPEAALERIEPIVQSCTTGPGCDNLLDRAQAIRDFPMVCEDSATGELLGSDDYVAGYSQMYLYQDITNANPVLAGLELDDAAPAACTCIDAACLTEPECTDPPTVPVCTDASCPEHSFKPLFPNGMPDAELDPLSREGLREQMWINYYIDRGSLTHPVKLLNDATQGFNRDYVTEFHAPREPGPMHVWAVVHDNRGGQSWIRQTLDVTR